MEQVCYECRNRCRAEAAHRGHGRTSTWTALSSKSWLSGIGLWDRIEEIKHGGRENYWETGAEFQTQTIKVATEGKSRGAFAIETLQKNPEEQADESRAGGSWKNWVTCKVVNGTLWESYRCRQSSWSWSLTPRRLPLTPSRKVFVETTCWLCSISTWCYWLWGSQRLPRCGTQGSKGEVLEQRHRLCLGAQGGIFFRKPFKVSKGIDQILAIHETFQCYLAYKQSTACSHTLALHSSFRFLSCFLTWETRGWTRSVVWGCGPWSPKGPGNHFKSSLSCFKCFLWTKDSPG